MCRECFARTTQSTEDQSRNNFLTPMIVIATLHPHLEQEGGGDVAMASSSLVFQQKTKLA